MAPALKRDVLITLGYSAGAPPARGRDRPQTAGSMSMRCRRSSTHRSSSAMKNGPCRCWASIPRMLSQEVRHRMNTVRDRSPPADLPGLRFRHQRIGVAGGNPCCARPAAAGHGQGSGDARFERIARLLTSGSPMPWWSACPSTPTVQPTRTPAAPGASPASFTAGSPCRCRVDERYSTTEALAQGAGADVDAASRPSFSTNTCGACRDGDQATPTISTRSKAPEHPQPRTHRPCTQRCGRRAALWRPGLQVGIWSGGAWLAERLHADLRLPGKPGVITSAPCTATTSAPAASATADATKIPVRGRWRAHPAHRRRAVHRPHHPGGAQRAVRLRPPGQRHAGGAGRPRWPRAADPARLARAQAGAPAAQRARWRALDDGQFTFRSDNDRCCNDESQAQPPTAS